MRIALFQPDMPGNVGTLLRLGACLDVPVDVIGPCGFPFSERSVRRAAMDYLAQSDFVLHSDWDSFCTTITGRLLLFSTQAAQDHVHCAYRADDILLFGRESAGVPDHVRARADMALRIPLRPGLRSLNLATAAAMAVGEALRQTGLFPNDCPND